MSGRKDCSCWNAYILLLFSHQHQWVNIHNFNLKRYDLLRHCDYFCDYNMATQYIKTHLLFPIIPVPEHFLHANFSLWNKQLKSLNLRFLSSHICLSRHLRISAYREKYNKMIQRYSLQQRCIVFILLLLFI